MNGNRSCGTACSVSGMTAWIDRRVLPLSPRKNREQGPDFGSNKKKSMTNVRPREQKLRRLTVVKVPLQGGAKLIGYRRS